MKMCLEVRHVRFKDNKITIKKKEAKREGEEGTRPKESGQISSVIALATKWICDLVTSCQDSASK